MSDQPTVNEQTTLSAYYAKDGNLTAPQKETIRELFLRMILVAPGKGLHYDFQKKLKAKCGTNKPEFRNEAMITQVFTGAHDQQAKIESSWQELAAENSWLELPLSEFIARAMATCILKKVPGNDNRYNNSLEELYAKIFACFPREFFDICDHKMKEMVNEAKREVESDDIPRLMEIRKRLSGIEKAVPRATEVYAAPEAGTPESFVRHSGETGGKIAPYAGPTRVRR